MELCSVVILKLTKNDSIKCAKVPNAVDKCSEIYFYGLVRAENTKHLLRECCPLKIAMGEQFRQRDRLHTIAYHVIEHIVQFANI